MSINKVVIPKYECKVKTSGEIVKKPTPDETDVPEISSGTEAEEKNVKNKKKKDKSTNDIIEVYNIQRKTVLVIIILLILSCAICPLIIVCIKKYGSKGNSSTNTSETFNTLTDDFKDISSPTILSTPPVHKPSFEIPVPAAHFQKVPDIIEPINTSTSNTTSHNTTGNIVSESNHVSTPTSSTISPAPLKILTIPSSSLHSSVQPIISKINSLNDISDQSKTIKIPTGVEDFF